MTSAEQEQGRSASGRESRRPALVTAAVAVLALGIVTLNVPALIGPYGPLAIILVGLPYGAIGLTGALAAFGLWREHSWGRPLALAWAVATSVGAALGLLASWGPVMGSLADPSVGYNVAQFELYLPVPFLAGAGYVLLALLRVPRTIWRVAALLLIASVLVIAVAALTSQAQPPIGPAPVEPAPTAP